MNSKSDQVQTVQAASGHDSNTSPSDVYRRLEKRYKTQGNGQDKRRFPRKTWSVSLGILLDEHDGEREIKAVTHDISKGGLSFVHQQFLYPGCKLWVSIESLPDRPVLMGIIMSCTHVSGMLHRIGIKFVAREKD